MRRTRRVARVIWPDGSETQARSWAALLRKVADDQWDELDDDELVAELAFRAKVWSDTRVDTTLNARGFFRELERADMLTIMEDVK